MKTVLMILLCFFAFKSFSQSNDVVIEERSSDWIKITAATRTTKSKTTTVRKKTSSKKPSAPKQDAQQEFEKTNNAINRFKKSKKG